jgi:hypothetical protein
MTDEAAMSKLRYPEDGEDRRKLTFGLAGRRKCNKMRACIKMSRGGNLSFHHTKQDVYFNQY